MGKIVFFEEKNFGGCHYECSNDCTDLHLHLSQCNSIRVESGCFMLYESPNYIGNQYFVCQGEYPEFQKCMAATDSISSCRLIPQVKDSFKLSVFERIEFGGQMMDITENCPCLKDRFQTSDVFSCKAMEGNWLFFEHPNYEGRMYLIMPGEYKRFSEWGGVNARVGSIKRIVNN